KRVTFVEHSMELAQVLRRICNTRFLTICRANALVDRQQLACCLLDLRRLEAVIGLAQLIRRPRICWRRNNRCCPASNDASCAATCERSAAKPPRGTVCRIRGDRAAPRALAQP